MWTYLILSTWPPPRPGPALHCLVPSYVSRSRLLGEKLLESQKHVVVVTMSDSERQETFMKSGQKFYGLGNQNNFLFFGIFDETFGYNKFVCKLFFWSKMLFTPRGASQIKVVGENLLLSIETSLGAIFNNCNKTHVAITFPAAFSTGMRADNGKQSVTILITFVMACHDMSLAIIAWALLPISHWLVTGQCLIRLC